MAPPTIGGPPVGSSGPTPRGAAPHGASLSRSHPSERSSRSARHVDERKSELVCRVKYSNTLPDIPFDPKFIAYPFETNRFIHYVPTSLERNYKYELLTEPDLGVTVDLIRPETYAKPEQEFDEYGNKVDPPLDPKDERLLEEDMSDKTDAKRSQRHAQILSWMRRPDYISTEQTRYQPTTIEKIESKVGFAVRKKMGNVQPIFMDREAQVAAIEKTFEDAKIPIEKHYSKAGVYPVDVVPILPDDKMWKYPCAQVIFDSDPAPQVEGAGNPVQQNEMMSQAMIRGVMDESGEQFVAYFLPTIENMEKRAEDMVEGREYDEEGSYEYKMFREYNWNVKSKATKGYEENFFFIVREDGVFYNELETRVRLSKRRLKAGQQPSNSKLVVKHRPLGKQEHKMQRYREKYLEPPNEEDEEMSEDEEEEEAEDMIKDTENDDEVQSRSRSSSPARSRSRSKSGSVASSRSRSISRSRSRSVSRSRSRSRSRSKSGSVQSRAASRSVSKSPSRSRSVSRSVSRSRSGSPASRSRSSSGSRSAASAKSGSESD